MDSETLTFTTGTPRLFAESTVSARFGTSQDQHGFLEASPDFFTFERLIEQPCSLVAAPPWIGKTFTAKRIESHLRTRSGIFLELTSLDARLTGTPLTPSWWVDWQNSQCEGFWIIDALDEGQRREASLCLAIVRLMEKLTLEQRKRLRLLILAREAELKELAPGFAEDLAKIFSGGFFTAELLPLDRLNAIEVLREEDWKRTLTIIERNGLQSVAGYPAALLFLARQPSDVNLTVRNVWKGVLQQLLEENNTYRQQSFLTEGESRFYAAARMAAVLTLTIEEELAGNEVTQHPTISQIFQFPEPSYVKATRAAAREALRSAMFHPTPSGYRFLHKNVREWMAAFGIAELPLAKLRPFLQSTSDSLESVIIRPEFRDLARLLEEVHEDREVKDWIRGALTALPSDLFLPTIQDVRIRLDRLEKLAARGARLRWIHDTAIVSRLAVPGLGVELATRVEDGARDTAVRVALLQIGMELNLDEVLVAASTIIQDYSQNEELRYWCARALAESQRVDLLRELEHLLSGGVGATTRLGKAIVSTLLAAYIEQGLWSSAQAFRYIPQGISDQIADATHLLPYIFERNMTVEDSEEILVSLGSSEVGKLNKAVDDQYKKGGVRADPRWKVFSLAVSKLATAEPFDLARSKRLIPFVLSLGSRMVHGGVIGSLAEMFRLSEPARREMLEAAVAARKARSLQPGHVWRWIQRLLGPEDLSWFEETLVNIADDMPDIWSFALNLSDRTEDRKLRRRVRRTVKLHAPAVLSSHDKLRDKHRRVERKEQLKSVEAEAAKRHIVDVNRDLLARLVSSNRQNIFWQLSWVNFSSDEVRPSNLIGAWVDVPDELRDKVLDVCMSALDTIDPTPVPEGSSYPSVLRYEADAFVSLLRIDDKRFRLTRGRIERWLPAVLKTSPRDTDKLLEDCYRVASDVVENLVIETIEREIRERKIYSVFLQDLPTFLWTERVTHWVVAGIEGAQPAGIRARLLELLALRRPQEGLQVARVVLSNRTMKDILFVDDAGCILGDPEDLGIQALEVLLALSPDEAWPRVEAGAALIGRGLLERLRGLTSNAREGLEVHWREWPLERIVSLIKLLFSAYPPERDPSVSGGSVVTPAYDFRHLRWRMLDYLINLNSAEGVSAAESAKDIHPKAREAIESLQASRAANALLAEPMAPVDGGISVIEACRLLDDKYYRLIRSADDLLEVVLEEFKGFEQDMGYDYSMLFYPVEEGGLEHRQHETVLQAYVQRRLQDRLPGKILDRETQVKWRQRADIRVMAPVIDRRESAVVVIEIKWSDNSDSKRGISTGLVEKLGKEYLLAEGLFHGIFLVGWTGKLGTWKTGGGPRPKKSAASLADALSRQAAEFRREHPMIDIRPVVWDLSRKFKEDPGESLKARDFRGAKKAPSRKKRT